MKISKIIDKSRDLSAFFIKSAGEIPQDFDWRTYLLINPDVHSNGMDPAIHYLRHGRSEKRLYSFGSLNPHPLQYQVTRKTVLVVSHNASRTGAPILALNLIKELIPRYNVVCLLLGPGSLTSHFKSISSLVCEIPANAGIVYDYQLLRRLNELFKFEFALLNTMESGRLLPLLELIKVPSILMVHEFATNYAPAHHAVAHITNWATRLVYSSELTLEDARYHYLGMNPHRVHVIPQGRCSVPQEEDLQARGIEVRRITKLVRPANVPDCAIVILGIGTVALRKGVDLFIQTAAQVIRKAPSLQFRFVWIGLGLESALTPSEYSIYVLDQIKRSGLQDHMAFTGETTQVDAAYSAADMLMLTSRLDPLPGVAWEAMDHGLPVVCFDNTTGTAEFLEQSGLRHECIARYLDSADMALKIVALAQDKPLRLRIGNELRKRISTERNMPSYVAELLKVAQWAVDQEIERSKQAALDIQTIIESKLFRQDFFSRQFPYQPIQEDAHDYVQSWAKGIAKRKSLPGFHPAVYRASQQSAIDPCDPLAHYIRAGCPDGPWLETLISPSQGKFTSPMNADTHRIALHIHAYYPDLLPTILDRLQYNRIQPDIYISTCSHQASQQISFDLRSRNLNVISVSVVPNLGRDMGPFFTEFGKALQEQYSIVGHVHTKKSIHVTQRSVLDRWNTFLLDNLLGEKACPMLDTIIDAMCNDPSIGIVFPDDPNALGWELNLNEAQKIAFSLGIQNLPEHFNFPVGTMFWAKTKALDPLFNLKLNYEDYPREPLPVDGTMLHAIERMLPVVATKSGYKVALTNVPGVTR